ncbi:unnamed protein product [Victoria cruziana]
MVALLINGFRLQGVGQLLAAVAAAFVVRIITVSPPELPPDVEEAELDDERSEEEPPPPAGKVVPVSLRWSNITCSLAEKSGKSVRHLLAGVSGEAKPGRLLAIMGPSGAGKTTLLNVLAGQLAASPRLRLSGILHVNGKPRSISAYKIAYVRQEDIFFSQLTVRETLSLAAELQLPELSSSEDRDRYVNKLLLRMGLVRLDAFQAERVMETLQQLSQDGHTVICSIHQPRGSVYAKFDDIVLLSEGVCVYTGPAEEALSYFMQLGYSCPDHVNPAEFLADLISVDYTSAESIEHSQKRIEGLAEHFSSTVHLSPLSLQSRIKQGSRFARKSIRKQNVCWWRQFWLLLRRAWMQALRDGPTNIVRTRMSVASALIFGSVFWRMGRSQTSIQDRMGLLQVAAINTAMAALTKTVGVFPKERSIVDRENKKGSYALGPYLLSKLIAEIPIGAAFPLIFGTILYPMARLHPSLSRFGKFCGLVTVESFAASAMGLTVGAMVPTTEAAMALGPSLMTVFIVFGGYYINTENAPVIFRWIPQVSLIRWAFQGLCINEFTGLQFDQHQPFDIQTGEQVLERLSFGGSHIPQTVLAQGRILMFWYWTTYVLLHKNKPKYQQLEPPPQSEA